MLVHGIKVKHFAVMLIEHLLANLSFCRLLLVKIRFVSMLFNQSLHLSFES